MDDDDLTLEEFKTYTAIIRARIKALEKKAIARLSMTAEVSTTEISKKELPKGLTENIKVVRKGAAVTGNASREIEEITGKGGK